MFNGNKIPIYGYEKPINRQNQDAEFKDYILKKEIGKSKYDQLIKAIKKNQRNTS